MVTGINEELNKCQLFLLFVWCLLWNMYECAFSFRCDIFTVLSGGILEILCMYAG